MSDLSMVRDFFIIKEAFENGDFSLQTISDLIVTIRTYRNKLTSEQAVLLLDIPLNVLENDVELKDNGLWQKSNRDYFSGNMNVHDSDYIKELKERITLASFGLKDIYDLTKYVQGNFKVLSGVDFLLRNAEVTIRDDVKLKTYSTFNNSGKAFAFYIERAFL
ncbi:hypothetical protein NSQ59_27185 [Margalitia sp. FSL K6-0131]|uniref:hypothetical protein n=1 Tax=Margalitia sp. FSL K6-0131 TaxID=2954604 RepID=UPI0030F9886B